MDVIVVTRNGFGDVWKFDSRASALASPIFQYGDAIFEDFEKMAYVYCPLRLEKLLSSRLHELPSCDNVLYTVRKCIADRVSTRVALNTITSCSYAEKLWDEIVNYARVPPSSATEIIKIVENDRDQFNVESQKMPEAEKKEAAAAKEKAPKKQKEVVDTAEKTINGFPYSTKLEFGTGIREVESKKKGADGKTEVTIEKVEFTYDGTKNNPKREGSASAERFALYRKGITIAKALEAGMSAGNISHDLKKGYVRPLTA